MAERKHSDLSFPGQEFGKLKGPGEAVEESWRKQALEKAKRMHEKDASVDVESTAKRLFGEELEKYVVADGAGAAALAASETMRAAQESAWVTAKPRAHSTYTLPEPKVDVPDSVRGRLHNPERLQFWRDSVVPMIETGPGRVHAVVPGKTMFTCPVRSKEDMEQALDLIDDHNLVNANARVCPSYFVVIGRDLWFVARSPRGGYISSVFLDSAPGSNLGWYGRNAKPAGWKSGVPLSPTDTDISRAQAMAIFLKLLLVIVSLKV